MDHPKQNASELRTITLDMMPVSYVRPVQTDKGVHYAVCSADGTALAMFATREAAYFAAKQHDLEPVSVH